MSKIERILEYINAIRIISGTSTEDEMQTIKMLATEAKEVIEELYNIIPASMADYAKEPMEHARKFMTEE